MAQQSKTVVALVLACTGVVCSGLAMSGCRGDRTNAPPRQFIPDMDDQPRWSPQAESQFFADGRTMRPPAEGSVAFGAWGSLADPAGVGELVADRASFLQADDAVYQGLDANGEPVLAIPVDLTQAMLQRGQERFNIFCAVCHGYEGDGQGTAGRFWAAPVPSFHDPKYFEGGDVGQAGHLFRVAMWGLRQPDGTTRMPGYAHALGADDAWAVVGYVRALQASRNGSIEDPSIPEPTRQDLEQQRASTPGTADDAQTAMGGQP